MEANKWPKILQPLTPEQQIISDDFMKDWHEILSSKSTYKLLADRFGHTYVINHAPESFETTLEIGAGLGEHIHYEKLSLEQQQKYVALELRQNMADKIKEQFPAIATHVGDCQKTLPFGDGHFDRILAIHVLEHLPNLPATIREMHRLCNKQHGYLSIVIPCEGGLAYSLGRRLSAQRIFERKYKQPYKWFIEREHINRPHEIFEELMPYFDITHRSFFPLMVPIIHCNLFIGITLKPKKRVG